uniref:Orf c04035 protein n=1 Tax=Saccharolobus solfataricus TaxID=2287 RepID=P95973_SACSO|nr:orf c04035 [Saccharolobus solfataricus P2]
MAAGVLLSTPSIIIPCESAEGKYGSSKDNGSAISAKTRLITIPAAIILSFALLVDLLKSSSSGSTNAPGNIPSNRTPPFLTFTLFDVADNAWKISCIATETPIASNM